MAELPTDPPSGLPLDLAALIKLAKRSQDLLYDDSESTGYMNLRQNLRLGSAEMAIVAAARTAAHIGAIGLVPDVRRWAEFSPTGVDPVSIAHLLIDALAVCVSDGFDVERLEPMLAGFDDWMIAKIADVLDPEQERSLALLQRLADDPRARVSTAASKRLGARRQWCWWAGCFEHDPIVAHADDPAIVEALERARAALGRQSAAAQPAQAPDLCAAVEGLPSALAIPLLEAGVRTFPFSSFHFDPSDEPLVPKLHALGGVDALARALERMLPSQGDVESALQRIAPWFKGLPDSVRVELALRLLSWIDGDDEPTRLGAARFIRHTWPHAASPVPLIEWLVTRGREHVIPSALLRVPLKDCTAELEPDGERLIELAASHPTLLHELPKLYTALGDTVSEAQLIRLVDMAATAQASDSRLRIWALEQRTARLAPTDAAERDALAQAWLDDPDQRSMISRSDLCSARLLPWLRRRLRAGALTLAEANQTIFAIGRLYGGVTTGGNPLTSPKSELEAADRRKHNRALLGVWVDEPSGPATAEEWTCLRAAARHELATSDRPVGILWARPIGPWRPEDLALFDEIEHRALSTGSDGVLLLMHLEQLLKYAEVPDASARAGRLVAAWQDHPLAKHPAFMTLRRLATKAQATSEQDPAAAPASARPTTLDWMDEEDQES